MTWHDSPNPPNLFNPSLHSLSGSPGPIRQIILRWIHAKSKTCLGFAWHQAADSTRDFVRWGESHSGGFDSVNWFHDASNWHINFDRPTFDRRKTDSFSKIVDKILFATMQTVARSWYRNDWPWSLWQSDARFELTPTRWLTNVARLIVCRLFPYDIRSRWRLSQELGFSRAPSTLSWK